MSLLSIKNDCLNAELHTESGHSTEVRSDSPRRSQADHASASPRSRSEHAQVLTATVTCSLEIEDSTLTGCLTTRVSWSLTLSPQVSDSIRAYRPRLPCAQWAPVAGLVRATVTAAAPANCAQARRMLYAVGRLAVWAEQVGLVRDPGTLAEARDHQRVHRHGPRRP